LGEKDGVTLRIYTRHVTPVEEKKIISNAANKNRLSKSNTNDLQQTVMAESNLQDVATIVAQAHRNREPFIHSSVYIELSAYDLDQLKLLQTEVMTELIRSKLNVDRLILRQQQGFQCVMPSGFNVFRDQFERVLPASSVANLYPFNYSGKTDANGFYVVRDKFGSNVLVDFNKRADDKTNANILIHISFLKDFFRTYKDFTDREIDTIEIILQKLYAKFGISDSTRFDRLTAKDYPILSDLYALIEEEYKTFDENSRQLYTAELLQNILLGLHSICKGAESKFFDGHTNITDSSFVTFGVKGLLQASKSLKNALLFNILSYMSNELLTNGNTAASIDEFYLFLTNLTAVEYVRNFSKRVRKKDSAVIITSQNLEDFNIEGIREYTKPLFSIPTHQFLFNVGNIDAKFYIDTLQLEQSEYNLIRYPQRGVCLYKCGNERYNLMVNAPEHKAKLFGKAGGR
jgi:hypothetical protein